MQRFKSDLFCLCLLWQHLLLNGSFFNKCNKIRLNFTVCPLVVTKQNAQNRKFRFALRHNFHINWNMSLANRTMSFSEKFMLSDKIEILYASFLNNNWITAKSAWLSSQFYQNCSCPCKWCNTKSVVILSFYQERFSINDIYTIWREKLWNFKSELSYN